MAVARSKILCLAGLWACGIHVSTRGDVIHFKDGRREMEGVIVERGETQVCVRQGKARIRVPVANIASIDEGSEADHLMIEAREVLADGNTETGLGILSRAQETGADPAAVARALVVHQGEIHEAVGRMNSAEADGFKGLLDRLGEVQSPQQAEWLAAQIRWWIELGGSDKVSRLMDEFRQAEPKAFESRSREILRWLGAGTDRALEEEDFSLALDFLLEMGALDRVEAGNRRIEMALLWARRERDRHDYEAAVRVYQDQLMPLSPKIAQDRISVALDDAERHFRSVHELGRAIDLYEKYGLVHEPDRSRERLIELWHEFGRQFLANGQVEEARRLFERSEKLIPGSAERELALCDHAEIEAGLEAGDHVGHYKLGEWCVEKGLLNQARKAFEKASGSEVLREAVWEQIQLINDRQAEEDLARLLNLYESGKYVQVLDGVLQFKSRPAAEGLHAQAAQLERLSRDAIAVSVAERPQQAEVLMQQAERAYWTGEVEQAHELLGTLTGMYADTPAGARAAQFYRMIKPRLDLDTLERRRKARPQAGGDGTDSGGEGGPESAIADEIRHLRDAMREREVEQKDGIGNNEPARENPAVDLSVIPGQQP